MTTHKFELWADSFHEGHWACTQLAKVAAPLGWKHSHKYNQGFIPVHSYQQEKATIEITVYGSYKSWEELPSQIEDLLAWGKPDFVLFDSVTKKIIFAVEETAAVPTGNQALQRCERLYGSARSKIPFWYLLSEYGVHKDKGIRRDSIWPTVMALKLTHQHRTPCVVLHYSDLENPESYTSGTGLASLFGILFQIIANVSSSKEPFANLEDSFQTQYQAMLSFVTSQWGNIINFLPGADHLSSKSISKTFASMATNPTAYIPWPNNFLIWPKISGLPKEIKEQQHGKSLIKHDPLCEQFEKALTDGKAYSLSDNAGSKPQPEKSLLEWITSQSKLFKKAETLSPKAEFTIKLSDFPTSTGTNRHVTTAKNIVYLYDKWGDVRNSIEKIYPRLRGKLDRTKDNSPALVYLSNSVKPGRIFGDPFTGQISAYATAFGKFDSEPRIVLAYFPHQVHSQAIVSPGESKNKGITIMSELTDYLLFSGGVAVQLNTGAVL